MHLRWDTLTIAASDAAALASFWSELLQAEVRGTWQQYVGLEPCAPGQPRLAFQTVADLPATRAGTGGHLDLHVPDRAHLGPAVERALALGASDVGPVEQDGQVWHVLADPEGNRFCIVVD